MSTLRRLGTGRGGGDMRERLRGLRRSLRELDEVVDVEERLRGVDELGGC